MYFQREHISCEFLLGKEAKGSSVQLGVPHRRQRLGDCVAFWVKMKFGSV